MKKALRPPALALCAVLSVLAALFLLTAWPLEKTAALLRRVSWRLDVAANITGAWGGDGEGGDTVG
jgi:hypothetical protein